MEWNVVIPLLGTGIQTVVTVGSIVWMFLAQKSDVRVIKHDLNMLKDAQRVLNEAFTQLGKILTQVAVQDNRLNMVEKSVDEMRHGQGFVSPLRG